MSEKIYKEVAQAVLLFGAETWVITPRMERALDSFHRRFAQHLTGRQSRRRGNGSYAYPSLEEAVGGAGSKGIRKYFTRRKNMVTQYIATRPILDLCERSTQRPGVRISKQWWE